jgi:ketosteroid isomerase-like protein
MKKPSLKREKKPAAHELATADPFAPVPVKESRIKLKKKPLPGSAPAPGAAPAAPVAPEPKKKKGKKEKSAKGSGRVKGALGAPFRLLAKPFRKLGSLKGRTRIIVFGLIAIIVVIGALQLRGGRDDAKLVREALARYEAASRTKDYQTLCDDLLASSYVKQTASSGLPCEVALRTALEDVRNPTLKVISVEVNGDRAAARVTGSAAGQVPGDAVYTLIREDDTWKILPPRPGNAAP